MEGVEDPFDALRAQILRAVDLGAEISSRGGSVLLADEVPGWADGSEPDPGRRFYAALVIRMEYAPTLDGALAALTNTIRGIVDAEEERLRKAREAEPGKG